LTHPLAVVQSTGVNNSVAFARWQQRAAIKLGHATHSSDHEMVIGVTLMYVCLQDAFPMRIKGLHVVNEPSIFGTIFAIVKPFLKEKTVQRVCITRKCLVEYYDCIATG